MPLVLLVYKYNKRMINHMLLYANAKKTSKGAVYTAFVAPSRLKNESVTNGPTDGRTNGPTDQRTDKASYRDARTHLKMMKKPLLHHHPLCVK